MAYRFMGVLRHLPSGPRNLLLIAILVAAVLASLTTIAFSDGGPFIFTSGTMGVMPPDMKFERTTPDGGVIHYTSRQERGAATILRDGKPWIKLTYRNGEYEISDPTVLGGAVVRTSTAKTKPGYLMKSSEKGR